MLTLSRLKIILALLAPICLFVHSFYVYVAVLFLLSVVFFQRLKELKVFKFWVLLFVFSFLPALFLRSGDMLQISAMLFLKSLIFYIAVIGVAENINFSNLQRYFPRIMQKRMAVILVVAINLIPVIRNTLLNNYALFYLKSKSTQRWYKEFYAYVCVTFKQIIQMADQCAENMILQNQQKKPLIVLVKDDGLCKKQECVQKLKENHWPVSGVLIERNEAVKNKVRVCDIKTGVVQNFSLKDFNLEQGLESVHLTQLTQPGLQFIEKTLQNFDAYGIVFLDEFGCAAFFANDNSSIIVDKLLVANISSLFVVVKERVFADFIEKIAPNFLYEII